MKTYLSLGWGVQSFAIAAMVALGDLPPITAAIHADTLHESEHTYAFAARWTEWLEKHGVSVVTVQPPAPAQLFSPTKTGNINVFMPVYVDKGDGKRPAQLPRQCTERWKIQPLRNWIRPHLEKREVGTMWLGISTDEVQRAKASRVKYLKYAFPLLDLDMSRNDCVEYLQLHGLEVPPKSACYQCPFHSPTAWGAIKRENGGDWKAAVDLDTQLREREGLARFRRGAYLHSSGKPLAQAVTIPEDFGHEQGTFDLDNAACDSGHCFL